MDVRRASSELTMLPTPEATCDRCDWKGKPELLRRHKTKECHGKDHNVYGIPIAVVNNQFACPVDFCSRRCNSKDKLFAHCREVHQYFRGMDVQRHREECAKYVQQQQPASTTSTGPSHPPAHPPTILDASDPSQGDAYALPANDANDNNGLPGHNDHPPADHPLPANNAPVLLTGPALPVGTAPPASKSNSPLSLPAPPGSDAGAGNIHQDPLCFLEMLAPLQQWGIFYQKDLRLLVCSKCDLAVFPDHLAGHLRDNAKHKHSPRPSKASVQAALARVTEPLLPTRGDPDMPRRRIPPLPWLQDPVPGYKCRHCCYCSASTKTTRRHSQTNHPHQSHTDAYDTQVWVQALFSKGRGKGSMYFQVFPPLQNCDPDGLYSRFLQRLDLAFQEGTLFKDSGSSTSIKADDYAPFVTRAGWADAIQGYSTLAIRQSVSRAIRKSDPAFFGRVIGMGAKYLLSMDSTKEIQPLLLESLTRWRMRRQAFQLLQERSSAQSYGALADKLVLMILRSLYAQFPTTSAASSLGDATTVLMERDLDDASIAEAHSDGRTSDRGNGSDEEEEELDADGDIEFQCDVLELDDDENEDADNDEDNVDADTDGDGRDEDSGDADSGDDSGDVDSGGTDNGDVDDTNTDNAGEDVDEDEDMNIVEDPDPDHDRFDVHLSLAQQKCAKALAHFLEDETSSERSILEAYHAVILSAFTSQSRKGLSDRFHSTVDAFMILNSIDVEGKFTPVERNSPEFSKLQYVALYSILSEVVKAEDPIRKFDNDMAIWLDPSKMVPFAALRRYHRIAYSIVRNQLGTPRIQFPSRRGTDFIFDGQHSSAKELTNIYHDAFEELHQILRQDLCLGLQDDVLGPLRDPASIIDNSQLRKLGYGVLVSEIDEGWKLVRAILQSEDHRKRFFYINEAGDPVLKHAGGEFYLDRARRFKELVYFLIHQIAGMPLRASEESRIKVADTAERSRNIYYMYGKLACVSFYNKTSHNTGLDKVNLRFIPPALEEDLRRFYSSCATFEAWIISQLVPDPDPLYLQHLFSSKGQHWRGPVFSRILQRETELRLGYSFSISQLRHILPAIADHYNISSLIERPSDAILHSQMGHTANTGQRLYSRAEQDHPVLTNRYAHDAMDFCDAWHALWGFSTPRPDCIGALRRQEEYASAKPIMTPTAVGSNHAPELAQAVEPHLEQENKNLRAKLDILTTNMANLTEMVASLAQQTAALSSNISVLLDRSAPRHLPNSPGASWEYEVPSPPSPRPPSPHFPSPPPPPHHVPEPGSLRDSIRPPPPSPSMQPSEQSNLNGGASISAESKSSPSLGLEESNAPFRCPKCQKSLNTLKERASHIRETSDSFHVFSSKVTWLGKSVRVHRQEDLAFRCFCGFSNPHIEQVQNHLNELAPNDEKHVDFRSDMPKPSFTVQSYVKRDLLDSHIPQSLGPHRVVLERKLVVQRACKCLGFLPSSPNVLPPHGSSWHTLLLPAPLPTAYHRRFQTTNLMRRQMWETAGRAGIKTANLLWCGPMQTSGNDCVPLSEKHDQLLAWIDMPFEERPQLLLDIVNAIFVSDHGMADASHPEWAHADDSDILGEGWELVKHRDGWPSMDLRFAPTANTSHILEKLLVTSQASTSSAPDSKPKFDVCTTPQLGFSPAPQDVAMPSRYHFTANDCLCRDVGCLWHACLVQPFCGLDDFAQARCDFRRWGAPTKRRFPFWCG
ncbi:hypothetical protein BV22DRAFT_1181093 [Leucogyrophana mollusca]|uniref:Uncharacterized protein n=1 Tax=Leucogyrophana mollusca TaxID=85980 RepID=A0ACB8B6G5_9AGAM|nr:hypothetical protein BV22DRAFT_1181093 [Leucogyrophana mollusca]